MRLLIDLQACQNGSRSRGIGRYSLALARAMCRNADRHEVYILLSDLFPATLASVRQELHGCLPEHRIVCFHAPGPVDELRPENAGRKQAAEWLRETMIAEFAPDALLVGSMVEGAMDNTVASVGRVDSGAVVGAILYDLIPLLDPERYIGWEPARRWYHDKLDSLRRCELLLCISESAASEAVNALGIPSDRVIPISTAADEKLVGMVVTQDDLAACRKRFGLARRYLMHSGNIEPRKNFDGLIRAFAALPKDLRSQYQLVLAGRVSGEGQKHLEAEAMQAGLLGDDLVLTGHVTDQELVALYAGCHLFVFPSFHEGFGLPALEAMHFGVPTIGSSTTSVPEVIGRADACFDPAVPAQITALMLRCLTDAPFYAELQSHARLQARRFDWNVIARRAWAAFEHALAARREGAATALPMSVASRRQTALSQLTAPQDTAGPNDIELAEIARCMLRNEAEAQRTSAYAGNGSQMTWRLEGPFDSSYSLALVNRESARALEALGHRVVLHSTEGPGDFAANPAFLEANPDLREMHAREPHEPAAAVDVQARNLYPPRVADMGGGFRILNQYAWEETAFPAEWVESFNRHLDGILCTASHVRKVLQDNGVTVPIAVVGNGVDHWEKVIATPGLRFAGRRFRLLHVSSCFPRKGVDALLAAYGDAFTDTDDVSLLIKTFANPHNDIHVQLAAHRSSNPRFPDVQIIEGDLSDADLKALYQQCHALVAPSRAEGFGLPLAEAMLSGLPVITTAWSGQLDFCNADNSWLVDYQFANARTHFEQLGSIWAEPDRNALADALRQAEATPAEERRAMAERGRQTLLQHYKWTDVAARAVLAVRQWAAIPAGRRERRLGWVTTWNTRCGIASYSRHIIEAAGRSTVVFAPRQDGLVEADEEFVHRSWLSSKEENAFGELALRIHDQGIDVLVVQFNFGFFKLSAFSEFLHGQIDAGRAVIVTMHATAEPPALALWDDNWRLSSVTAALARCQRLLVHSLADVNRLKQAGLVDNVTLFPHPLWHLPARAVATAQARPTLPLVATFGYCLPGKGLAEVVEAVRLLKQRGTPVRLLMLNAEYPDAVSGRLVTQLRQQILEFGMQDLVDFRAEYLADDEVASLLGNADLIMFAYQDTKESASGAVRHGLAARRPVLVTPIPIFDDLGGAVHRAQGVNPEQLADAIGLSLDGLDCDNEHSRAVEAAADAWRLTHDVHQLSRRLWQMASGLDLPPAANHYCFDGSSRALRTEVGHVEGSTLHSGGKAGYLLFGPYVSLPPGRYSVEIKWTYRIPEKSMCQVRVVVQGGVKPLCSCDITPGSESGQATTRLLFESDASCGDVEIQIQVGADVHATVHTVEVRLDTGGHSATPGQLGSGSQASRSVDQPEVA